MKLWLLDWTTIYGIYGNMEHMSIWMSSDAISTASRIFADSERWQFIWRTVWHVLCACDMISSLAQGFDSDFLGSGKKTGTPPNRLDQINGPFRTCSDSFGACRGAFGLSAFRVCATTQHQPLASCCCRCASTLGRSTCSLCRCHWWCCSEVQWCYLSNCQEDWLGHLGRIFKFMTPKKEHKYWFESFWIP